MIDLMIRENVDTYLRRFNSIRKFNLRQIEKNRFPVRCLCAVCGGSFLCRNIQQYVERQYCRGPHRNGNVRHVCWGCDLKKKIKIAAGALYHLINALPRAERDSQEIRLADWQTAAIPLPLQSNWYWRKLERWEREGVIACGMSDQSATSRDSQGLRDYSEATRLLTKFGKYEHHYRHKATSPVQIILVTPELAAFYLWLLGQLKTPDEQWSLKRIGRLYKNSCWWSEKRRPRLFDKAEASSWKTLQWKAANQK